MQYTRIAPALATIRHGYAVALVIALLALLSPTIEAQQAAPGSARVTLVARAPSARGQRTEVVRRAQLNPQNVVYVDQNATPEDLAGALALLQALRIQNGDQLQSDFRARPELVRTRPTWPHSSYRAWIVAQLVRLRTAAPTTHGDLGVVSAVQVTLPAAKGTVTGKAQP